MCSFVHPLAVSYALGIANQWDASKQYSKNIYTCEHTQTHPQTHTLEWNVIESSGSRQWMRERKGERNWLPPSPSISQRINTIEMLQCLFHIFRKNMQHAHIHRHTHTLAHTCITKFVDSRRESDAMPPFPSVALIFKVSRTMMHLLFIGRNAWSTVAQHVSRFLDIVWSFCVFRSR